MVLVTKIAEEATIIEEEQAAQEPSVLNMGVSCSRRRKGLDDEEQAAQEPPASNTGVSHSRKRRQVDEEPLAFQEQRSLGTALAQNSLNSMTGYAGRETQPAEPESIQVQ